MKLLPYLFIFFTSTAFANLNSVTGSIKFDTQNDGQPELIVNSTGVGIGITPQSNLHVQGNAQFSNKFSIGTNESNSSLHIGGTVGFGFQHISTNTTLEDTTVIFADSSSDNITLTLPYAGNVSGRQYKIKKVSALNSVWVSGGSNLIDDTNVIELPNSSSLSFVQLMSDGSQWFKLNQENASETIASDNLIVWWKFDNISDTAASDSTQNDFDSTGVNGDPMITANSGFIKNAVTLNSNDSYDLPNIESYFSSEATFSVWLKMDNNTPSTGNGGLATLTTHSQRTQYPFSDNRIYSNIFRSNRVSTGSNSSFDKTQWHHLCITSAPGTDNYIIYQNGEPFYTGSGQNSIVLGTDRLIGESDNYFFNGLMDDFRLYNKSLSHEEVRTLYNQGQ